MKVFEVDMPATLEVIFSQLKRNRMVWSLRALRRGERALPSLSKRPLAVVDWTALSVDTCKVDSTLAAVLTPIMFETGTVMSKTGEADDTISLDSKRCLWMKPVFEKLQRRQPQDKPLLNLNYAEYLLLFRRAAANLQVDMVPCGGRHSGASVDRAENLRTLESTQKTPTMEVSQIFTPPREKRTCQPKLVRARSIGPGTLRTLQQPFALGFASWPCITASTAPSFVIDI